MEREGGGGEGGEGGRYHPLAARTPMVEDRDTRRPLVGFGVVLLV